MRAVAVLVVIVSVTGCYSYVPVQSPVPGTEVRARLKADAAIRRSQGLDDPITRIDGVVVESSAQALALDVLVARSSSAFQNVTLRDTVRLESSEIEWVLQRKFSTARTALLVVGAGAAAAGIIAGIDQVVGGTDDPTDPGTPTFRKPGFVLSLRQALGWIR